MSDMSDMSDTNKGMSANVVAGEARRGGREKISRDLFFYVGHVGQSDRT